MRLLDALRIALHLSALRIALAVLPKRYRGGELRRDMLAHAERIKTEFEREAKR